MIIFDLIFGFLMVCAGRNLFWLCVGIVGFLVGMQCSTALGFFNSWMALFAALAFGTLGAWLAVSFEWLMIVLGVGFLGGGYLLMDVFSSTVGQDPYSWLIFVVGGIIGMCLMVITFDLALILISSLLGATLIVNAFHGSEGLRETMFIVCMVMGIVVQYSTKGDVSSTTDSGKESA